MTPLTSYTYTPIIIKTNTPIVITIDIEISMLWIRLWHG